MSSKSQATSQVLNSLVQPLEEFYNAAGLPLPRMKAIDGEKMPQPYRSLLVHNGDMTPALEQFHKKSIHLSVRHSVVNGDRYSRKVILLLDGSEKAVEYGAIQINLDLFNKKERQEILEGRRPLGGIMREHKTAHASRPKAYFEVEADDEIASALGVAKNGKLKLYGRRNTLFTPTGESLAEIVEILPL